MEIKIPAKNQLELFQNWIKFLNPILGLREETEIPVLAAFISLAYNYRDYDPSNLSSLLFSDDTKRSINNRLGFSEKSFNKSFRSLVEKEMIQLGFVDSEGRVSPARLNPRIIPKDFKLVIHFKIA